MSSTDVGMGSTDDGLGSMSCIDAGGIDIGMGGKSLGSMDSEDGICGKDIGLRDGEGSAHNAMQDVMSIGCIGGGSFRDEHDAVAEGTLLADGEVHAVRRHRVAP